MLPLRQIAEQSGGKYYPMVSKSNIHFALRDSIVRARQLNDSRFNATLELEVAPGYCTMGRPLQCRERASLFHCTVRDVQHDGGYLGCNINLGPFLWMASALAESDEAPSKIDLLLPLHLVQEKAKGADSSMLPVTALHPNTLARPSKHCLGLLWPHAPQVESEASG